MRQLKIQVQITNRNGKSIEAYLKEVSKQPMVTPDEEVELARRIKNNDMQALERLVTANLRFVISVAKQYQNYGLELEDLINEGNLGLIQAAKRFDETRGFKFISYAVWWIRQSILKAISEKNRKIRLPANRTKIAKDIAQAAIQIEQKFERQATEEEIAELLKMDYKEVRNLVEVTKNEGSIDAPIAESDDSSLKMIDVLEDQRTPGPTDGLADESLKTEIEKALAHLEEKEAEIIRLSFGIKGMYPMSIGDIGDQLGITQERVRQIRLKALKRLRKVSNLDQLKDFL